MEVVRQFEERSEEKGRRSMVKDVKKYASEFGLKLSLVHPQPLITCLMKDEEVPVKKIGVWLKTAAAERNVEEMKVEGWQESLLSERWEDQEVGEECFSWMSEWKTAPTHTIAGLQELYQQLLSTKVYHQKKTGTHKSQDVKCRMCGKAQQAHVLAGCGASVKIHDATQRSTQGNFLRAFERPRPSDIYTTVVFSEYAEAALRERERKGTLGRTTVCRIRGGEKQQDRLYCYRQGKEESGATRNELSMG